MDLLRGQLCLFHCFLQGDGYAGGGGFGFDEAGREVAGSAVAGDFGVNSGAPAAGVFELFEDDNAGALADDSAVSVAVEWSGGLGGLVVVVGAGAWNLWIASPNTAAATCWHSSFNRVNG